MDGQGAGSTGVLQKARNPVDAEHTEIQQRDEHVPVGTPSESALQKRRAFQISKEKTGRDGNPVD